MALNPSIILAGQQPDIAGGVYRANEQAHLQGQRNRENALASLMQRSGADIANGDQNALNALAGFDPQAALGIKQTRQGMAHSEERMEMARQQSRLQVQKFAAGLKASEAKAAAERLTAALEGATQAQTPEEWNAQLARNGMDPADYPWEQRAMILAQGLGAVEALKAVKVGDDEPGSEMPAAVQALQFRAQEAGLQPGTPAYQEFMARGGKSEKGMRLSVDPETGAVTFEEGTGVGGGGGKPLTVDQGKNTGFAIRMRDSNAILNDLEQEGTRLTQHLAGSIPLGNYLRTPEFRRYDQAKRDFINATLRRESGAVISDQEFANAEVQYFPQPGDDATTIAQKRRNREAVQAGIEISAGPGINDPRAQDRPQPEQPQEPVRLTPENADAAYQALPSGATFIAPDGTTRRKP